MFAFGIAVLLARAKSGGGVFRTIFYLPALAPPVAATLGFVYILNPATGPVNTILGAPRDPGAAVVPVAALVEAVARSLLGLWGVGNTMVIFLAAVLDVPQHLYESAELDGAGPLQRLRWVTLPIDQPGDPLRGRARRDPGAAVLHAGVRRGRASPPGRRRRRATRAATLGYPQDSTLFYPVLLYQHGFNDFQMGYASAMAMLLLVVSFAVTLVIVLNSRKWVHQAVPR